MRTGRGNDSYFTFNRYTFDLGVIIEMRADVSRETRVDRSGETE